MQLRILFLPLLFCLLLSCSKDETVVISGNVYTTCTCAPNCPMSNKNIFVYQGIAGGERIASIHTDRTGAFSMEVEEDLVTERIRMYYWEYLNTLPVAVTFQLPGKNQEGLVLYSNPIYTLPIEHTGGECYTDNIELWTYWTDATVNEIKVRGPFKTGMVANLELTNIAGGTNIELKDQVSFGLLLWDRKNYKEIKRKECTASVNQVCGMNESYKINLCEF